MGAKASVVLAGAELPARLFELEEPPRVLYLRGELPRGPAVALVGTRHPSPEGRRFCRELAAELAGAGVAVLSGGAQGIDTAAHRGALDAGGVTVVVAPGGFARPFPPENRRLFRRVVARGGAHLSLVEDDVPAIPPAFFVRNGYLAALAHAIVIVEAPLRSGARNAAKWARRLGRPLFAVPAAPWNVQGAGCNQELRLGARVLESARDVLRQLSAERLHPLPPLSAPPVTSPSARPAAPQLTLGFADGDEDRVLLAVSEGAGHPEEICATTGLAVGRVQGLVLTLTLKGALVPAPDGRLRVVAREDAPCAGASAGSGDGTQEPETID